MQGFFFVKHPKKDHVSGASVILLSIYPLSWERGKPRASSRGWGEAMEIHYSVFSDLAGFIIAAWYALKPIVRKVIKMVNKAAIINTMIPTFDL
jgi:hypothetical protein